MAQGIGSAPLVRFESTNHRSCTTVKVSVARGIHPAATQTGPQFSPTINQTGVRTVDYAWLWRRTNRYAPMSPMTILPRPQGSSRSSVAMEARRVRGERGRSWTQPAWCSDRGCAHWWCSANSSAAAFDMPIRLDMDQDHLYLFDTQSKSAL